MFACLSLDYVFDWVLILSTQFLLHVLFLTSSFEVKWALRTTLCWVECKLSRETTVDVTNCVYQELIATSTTWVMKPMPRTFSIQSPWWILADKNESLLKTFLDFFNKCLPKDVIKLHLRSKDEQESCCLNYAALSLTTENKRYVSLKYCDWKRMWKYLHVAWMPD